jgi:hypothetical protein
MDDTRYEGEDARWVSYAQLAQARGISKESAIRLVRRERWRKVLGNEVDGTVRVLVPEAWLKPLVREDARPVKAADLRADIPADLARITAGWEQAVVLSRLRAETAEARADRAEDRADKAGQRADRAEERADRAEARADELRDQLATTQQDAQAAAQAADEFRHREEARKGQGRWARLKTAWRGE